MKLCGLCKDLNTHYQYYGDRFPSTETRIGFAMFMLVGFVAGLWLGLCL